MVREDLVSSAVSFLQDPSVAASALDKRIAFLQSKNLTQEEIDIALARVGDGSQTENAVAPPPPSQYPYPGQHVTRQPTGYGYGPPRRDWRDWFIMATVTSGVGYGLYNVAKRYVFPLISPPTPPQLEADKASIDESFNRAFALIDQLATDTAAIKESETERTEKLDATLKDVGSVIEDLKATNTRREAESRIIADQVTGLKDMIPKALEGWKASGDAKLEELGQEVQSLKKLLENRVGRPSGAPIPAGRGYQNSNEKSKDSLPASNSTNSGTTTPNAESASGSSAPAPGVTVPKRESTPLRGFERSDRRAIPAWQMAAATTEKTDVGGSNLNAEASASEVGA
ncbi:MAG: peroxisomal membrane protein pex14 [Alectoria sarmentosa]|nr:MAG: peroxisomal membrane protein pex14 [Alectoria sarmentosa]